jgi:hypothetical protein
MPASRYKLVWLFLVLMVPAGARAAGVEKVADFFPDLDGWVKSGDPELYHADNLWEYIDGAADLFIVYNFQQVATLTYDHAPKQSLTVEIYEHNSPREAFGIYSQERPGRSDFLAVGTQGYYDQGILNFFQGNYYVKLTGFHLGDDEKAFLQGVAQSVAERLDGGKGFPEVLGCFPEKDKVANSERYIAGDFLGRSFLHSAYTAEYTQGDKTQRVFIIEADDTAQAEVMLKKYLEKVAVEAGAAADGGIYRFEDPYFRSDGPMNLKIEGRYIWGLFSEDKSVADHYIAAIGKRLAGKHGS